MTAPKHFTHVDEAVAFVRERLGKHWITAAPLGLGKPNRLLNALYRAAKADSSIHMKLMTALSLAPEVVDMAPISTISALPQLGKREREREQVCTSLQCCRCCWTSPSSHVHC